MVIENRILAGRKCLLIIAIKECWSAADESHGCPAFRRCYSDSGAPTALATSVHFRNAAALLLYIRNWLQVVPCKTAEAVVSVTEDRNPYFTPDKAHGRHKSNGI